jgi:glutamate-1-semialdehyde 2,1-aminomutase
VTLHLSRQDACADESNLSDLEEYTLRRYPNIKWILAHVARSFTYWPIKHGIERLRQLPNIYYDTSAVTELMPLVTLFKEESPKRIFYGSDGIDAMYFYGKYIALGRAWQGLDIAQMPMQFPHCDSRPILAIYEQLLCMKHAAEIAGFDQTDLDHIFYGNAQREFGVQFGSQ